MNLEKPEIKKLYYSISEVSKITELKQYVLRYWETEFKQLHPPKNRAGNRTYRQKDIELILRIKELLYDKKFTIDGARIKLEEEQNSDDPDSISCESKKEIFEKIKSELRAILDIITD